jgi:hypothetical protein
MVLKRRIPKEKAVLRRRRNLEEHTFLYTLYIHFNNVQRSTDLICSTYRYYTRLWKSAL